MLTTLHSSRRLVASLAAGLFLLNAAGPLALAELVELPAVSRVQIRYEAPESSEKPLIAHHEGAMGAGQLLTAGTSTSTSGVAVSDSLWGNLILGMAYQRDAQLQKLARKVGRMDTLLFATVAGVSGLGLAQSITTLATLNPPAPHHAEGEEEHAHADHHDSPAPSIMGIVGSGVTLASLGTRAYLGHRYKKQIVARQHTINDQVSHILDHLEKGEEGDHVRAELIGLIGDRATGEFLQLWQAVHR